MIRTNAYLKLLDSTRRALRSAAVLFGPAVLIALVGSAVASMQPPETPPQPGRLVYTRADAFQWDVYTSNIDGSAEQRLMDTNDSSLRGNASGETDPRWSPDGQEIAFATFNRDTEGTIWRMPWSGGTPTPVVLDDGDGQPAWSPDGRRIAYVGRRAGGEGLVDLKIWSEAGVELLLDTEDVDERRPDWSPDGERIAYAASPTNGEREDWDLRVVHADGTDDALLHDPGSGPYVNARFPRWSPDGSRIAFMAGHSFGLGTLCVLDVASGAVHPVAVAAAGPSAWSPDGTRLAYYNYREDGPALPATGDCPAPTPTDDPSAREGEMRGLYVAGVDDGSLTRPSGPAGGSTSTNAQGFEWGYGADWTAGTATPTPIASDTPTPTVTPIDTATPEATPTPTAPPPIYLPMTLNDFALEPVEP